MKKAANFFSKKSIKTTALLLSLITLAATFFTSCSNFLKGQEVKNEIESIIEYNNAPSYTINVEAIKGSGTIKTPVTGEVTKKVTDVFSIRFEPSDDYKFIKWEAVVQDLGPEEKASDYIEFEDATNLETKVTFKKASSKVIVINAVCPQRLTYTFEQDSGELYPRDTPFVFNFNQTLAAECSVQASSLTIQNLEDSEASTTYFSAPIINDKKLIFASDTSNGYLPIPASGQRSITVKIPKEQLWYVCNSYSEPVKVYLDADINKTCFVNNETSAKVKIKYSLRQKNEQPLGILKINGEEPGTKEYSYSVGTTLSVRYKLPDNYIFRNWSFVDSDGNQIASDKLNISVLYEDNANTFGYDSAANVAQMTMKIYNTMAQPVTVYPVIDDPVKITIAKGNDSSTVFRVNNLLLQDDTNFDCGIGKKLALKYKYSAAYKFYGWKVERKYNEDGVNKTDNIEIDQASLNAIKLSYEYEDNADTDGLDSQTSTAQIVFTVLDYIDGTITITPDVRAIPESPIIIKGQHGKITPSNSDDPIPIKQDVVNVISFEPDSDYGFVCWKVYNGDTELSDQNYITIADAYKENTTFTLNNIPAEDVTLAIKPYVVERPHVLSYWPMYDAGEGSLCDTTIEVVFDQEMSPESILLDDNEVSALESQSGVTLKSSTVYPGRYYGYEKGGKTFFKNISMEDKRNSLNITNYFDEPTIKGDTLYISVKTPALLTAGTVVVVTLDKDFCYTPKDFDDVEITMNASEKWRYLSNGETDTKDPTIIHDANNSGALDVKLLIKNIQVFSATTLTNLGQSVPDLTYNGSGWNSIENFLFNDGSKINFTLNNIVVSDTDSYPSPKFTLVCSRIFDEKYEAVTPPERNTKDVEYKTIFGENAKYSGSHDIENLDDGVYAVTYEFSDRSNNTLEFPGNNKAFYFVVDNTAPEVIGDITEVTASRGTNSFKVSIPQFSADVVEAYLEYKVKDASGNYTKGPDITPATDFEITGLSTTGESYQVRAVLKDRANNTSTSSDVIVYTKPKAPSITSCTAQSQSVIDVTWSKPSGVHNGYELYYRKSGVGTYTKLQISDDNQTTYRLQNLSPNTKYDIYMRTKNKDISEYSAATSVTNAITKPAVATVTGADAKIEDGNPAFDITWNKPAAGTYGTLTLYISNSNAFTADSNTYSADITDNLQNKLQIAKTNWSALDYDTTYYVKIVSTASEGGGTTDSSVITSYSYLSKVTNLQTSVINTDSVQLTWTNTYTSTDSGFKVYKDVNGTPTLIKEVNQKACAYGVMNLKGNTTYKLGIQRCRTVNGSVRTSEIEWLDNILTTPEPVTRLRAIRMNSPRRFNTTWVNPVNGYSDISVYLKEKGGEGDPEPVDDSITTSNNKGICDISFPSTTGNVIYEITVRTSNASGYSECTIEASTLDIRVKSFDVFDSSKSDVTLSWESPARSDTYKYNIYFLMDSSTIPETPDVIIDTQNPSPALVTDKNNTKLFSYTITDDLSRYIDTFIIAVVDADGNPANGTNNMESVSVTAVVPERSVRDITYLPNITSNALFNTLTVKWSETGISFDDYILRVVLDDPVETTIYDIPITSNDEGEAEYTVEANGVSQTKIVRGLRWLSEVYIFAGIISEDGIGKGYRRSEPGHIERP